MGSSSRRTDGACGARSLCLRERRTTKAAGAIVRDGVFVEVLACACVRASEPVRASVCWGPGVA